MSFYQLNNVFTFFSQLKTLLFCLIGFLGSQIALGQLAETTAVGKKVSSLAIPDTRKFLKEIDELVRALRLAKAEQQTLERKLAQLKRASPADSARSTARRQALANRLEKTGQQVAALGQALASRLAHTEGLNLPGQLVRQAQELVQSHLTQAGGTVFARAESPGLVVPGGPTNVQARLARLGDVQGQAARLADLPQPALNQGLRWADTLRLGQRLFLGGDFGLALGRKQAFVVVSPLVGYRLRERLSVGAGPVFQYYRATVTLTNPSGANYAVAGETLLYGGRAFVRPQLWKGLFAQGELEAVSARLPGVDGVPTSRRWVPGAWAGAGYAFPLAGRAVLNLTASWNLLWQEGQSPYPSPVDVRFGVQF
jgi:hypothetical protein